MQLARRLSPQKGDALKLLETSSATEESVARPQRGRKRKRLTSGSLTDNTQVTVEVSGTVAGNTMTTTSLTATKEKMKRACALEQKACYRAGHRNLAGSSDLVQELPAVSATAGQHNQSFSSTLTPASCTQNSVMNNSTSNLVIYSTQSLQKSPSMLSASSAEAAINSCATEGPLVSSMQLENEEGTVTATCIEASIVTASDSVSETAVAAAKVVEDAASNSKTLVPSSINAATTSCSQLSSTTDSQVPRLVSPHAGMVLSLNPSSSEMVPQGESSQLEPSALSSEAVVVSVSTPPTRAPQRLAAEPRSRILMLTNSSEATTASCKRNLVAVVPSGIKPEVVKELLLSSGRLSNTVVSGSANPLTSRSINASESNVATSCALRTTLGMVKAVRPKTPRHIVKVRRVVNKTESSSNVPRVVEQVDCPNKPRHTVTPHLTSTRRSKSPSQLLIFDSPVTTSQLGRGSSSNVRCVVEEVDCSGKLRHTVSPHSASAHRSKSPSRLLIPDCPVTASQGEVREKLPTRRTVGSQTLLNRPRLRHLCQRLKTLQRKCLRLQTHKQHLQQELSTARLEAKRAQTIVKELRLTQFQERVASGDARCLFLEEQLRCLDQPKHRWREETLQCCLLWNTVSPRGYRLICQSGLLSLPSCSTLKRHVDAVGNSTALNREPPSPTGETLPNMGDIDDIHELPDVVDVNLVENRTEEGSSEVSEQSDADDTDASSETTVPDNIATNESLDLPAERDQPSTKYAPLIVCPDSVHKLKSVRGSETGKKSLTRHFAKVLAGNSTPQEGEQLLQVVYTKPSDILDDIRTDDSVTLGAGGTTAAQECDNELAEETVVQNTRGDCSNADQTDCFEPTTEFMAPSIWLTGATDKPSNRAHIVTMPRKKKGAERSAIARKKCHQSMVKSNVLLSKPSRTNRVSSTVRKDALAIGCSSRAHQASNPSCTESANVAAKTKDFLSEGSLRREVASPPKDLAQLLNIVGANTTSEGTVSATYALNSVRGTVADNGTQKVALQQTNCPKDAAEPSAVPSATGSPIVNVVGSFPGDGAQVLNMICAEGGQRELFCGESSGEGNRVFEILYVCTSENSEAGQ